MAIRTIGAPGVEIREIDKSQKTPSMVGTGVLICGYTDKGVEFDPYQLNGLSDYEANLGIPTPGNDAERYSYYTAKEVFNNGGNVIFGKLPYNNTISTNYKFLGVNIASETAITTDDSVDLQSLTRYGTINKAEIAGLSSANVSTSDYDLIKAGGSFGGSTTSTDFIIVDKNKSGINEFNEGFFTVLVDPLSALNVQRMLDNQSDDDIMNILGNITADSTNISGELGILPTAKYSEESISEDIMRQFPSFEYTDGGDAISSEYNQWIGVVVCKVFRDEALEGKLNIGIVESHAGSIHEGQRDKSTGQTIYIGDIVNGNSSMVRWYKNPSAVLPTLADDTILVNTSTDHEIHGFTIAESEKKIDGATIVADMEKIFRKLSNIIETQIDIVVECGLGTISQFTDDVTGGTLYSPETDLDPSDRAITAGSDLASWRAVENSIINFCSKTRKDCMAILDAPRHLVLEGKEKFIRKTQPNNTFSNTIGKKLRYLSGLNSSYAALYTEWFRKLDVQTGINFWCPESTFMAGIYCLTDTTANFWDAPAGLNRGIIRGVNDIAYNPNDKEAAQVYKMSMNFAKKYMLDGFIAEGQKTTQVKPSAFDRVNVRRLFLRLERAVYQASRYFVYEPNNIFTRRRFKDVLDPIFKRIKSKGGMYDYKIVCSEKNNTPNVIDANEMKIAFLIKPTRTAEFILADFIATRTDSNFEEIEKEVL